MSRCRDFNNLLVKVQRSMRIRKDQGKERREKKSLARVSNNLLIISKFYALNLLQGKIPPRTNHLIRILTARSIIKIPKIESATCFILFAISTIVIFQPFNIIYIYIFLQWSNNNYSVKNYESIQILDVYDEMQQSY